MPNDPSDQLVANLIELTSRGSVAWEPVDFAGSAFIAKRPSGSVTVEGLSHLGMGSMGATMTIKDERGFVLDRVTSTPQMLALAQGSSSGARVQELYQVILDHRQKQEAKIQRIADDFMQ